MLLMVVVVFVTLTPLDGGGGGGSLGVVLPRHLHIHLFFAISVFAFRFGWVNSRLRQGVQVHWDLAACGHALAPKTPKTPNCGQLPVDGAS